jgi:hypothetical protein
MDCTVSAITLTCHREGWIVAMGGELGGGDLLASGGGTAGSAGVGVASPGVRPQVKAAGRARPGDSVSPRGKLLGPERCNCVQLFLVCQAGRAAASREHEISRGPGRGKAGRGGKDADAGGIPWGGAAVCAGGAGPTTAPWRTVAPPCQTV